ncbi:MAG: hypothetical protein KatS3mg076_0120 [Candidatus Binatia bacterium]|nr:MAG: hypothetical protein KatS3mg076_0120 [Candidatus Binatia bacterium]
MRRLRIPTPLLWLAARPLALYALYTLAVFVVAFVATFPGDLLVERILAAAENPHVSLLAREKRFRWLSGIELGGVRLSRKPVREGVPPILECASVVLRPDYFSLLRGNGPSFSLFSRLYGGDATVVATPEDGTVRATLEWSALDLARYRALRQWIPEGEIRGLFAGKGQLLWPSGPEDGEQPRASFEMLVADAAIEGAKVAGFGVPDLHFRELRTRWTLDGPQLQIEEFAAQGEELSVQASGVVGLRRPASRSTLNLRVTLQPGRGKKDALALLLALLPRPPEAKERMPIVVTGTLERPQFR